MSTYTTKVNDTAKYHRPKEGGSANELHTSLAKVVHHVLGESSPAAKETKSGSGKKPFLSEGGKDYQVTRRTRNEALGTLTETPPTERGNEGMLKKTHELINKHLDKHSKTTVKGGATKHGQHDGAYHYDGNED